MFFFFVGLKNRVNLVLFFKPWVVLSFSVYSHLTYALLAWGRSGRTNVAKIESVHRRTSKLLTDNKRNILTHHSIYDNFALLKAFNKNILNFYQYFIDKLSSHKPSHMHNNRHIKNSNFNTSLFKIIHKNSKMFSVPSNP